VQVWHGLPNKLTYDNSLKMKLSVIFGVTQVGETSNKKQKKKQKKNTKTRQTKKNFFFFLLRCRMVFSSKQQIIFLKATGQVLFSSLYLSLSSWSVSIVVFFLFFNFNFCSGFLHQNHRLKKTRKCEREHPWQNSLIRPKSYVVRKIFCVETCLKMQIHSQTFVWLERKQVSKKDRCFFATMQPQNNAIRTSYVVGQRSSNLFEGAAGHCGPGRLARESGAGNTTNTKNTQQHPNQQTHSTTKTGTRNKIVTSAFTTTGTFSKLRHVSYQKNGHRVGSVTKSIAPFLKHCECDL